MIQLIKCLQHVGIPVSDLIKSEAFYARLGFSKKMSRNFTFNGTQGQVSMMEKEQLMLELYRVHESVSANSSNRKDGPIDHIAFDVEDINEAFNLLRQNGFETLENEPVFLPFWEKGCKFFHIVGPDGERLEFNQILK